LSASSLVPTSTKVYRGPFAFLKPNSHNAIWLSSGRSEGQHLTGTESPLAYLAVPLRHSSASGRSPWSLSTPSSGIVNRHFPSIRWASRPRGSLRGIKGVRYYEKRHGVNGPLHSTSSIKEVLLFS
jgi:hypothetical protein